MRRRRAIALIPLSLGAAGLAPGADEPGGPGKARPLDEALSSGGAGRKTIRFRVASAGVLTGVQGEGMPPDLMPLDLVSDPLRDGGEFHVYINGKLLEDLHRLALARAECFRGAVVEATGTIRKVGLAPGSRIDYQMVVLDLDKFRIVEPPPR